MIYFLLLTALTVSIDSFACGFSLSLKGGKKSTIIIGITITVYLMCLIANYLTSFLSGAITEKSASLGGLILIGVGIYNLVKKPPKESCSLQRGTFAECLISGFAVGLDGALANLSLSIMRINAFYVPLIIALMHAFMITLGVLLARIPFVCKFAKIEFLPPVILILLGGYKLLGFFI